MAHRLPLADIKFIADFAAYARGRGDEPYNYGDDGHCACAQFLKDTGRAAEPAVGPEYWIDLSNWNSADLPEGVNRALNQREFDCRFSALADRLEALIADAPKVSS